MLIKTIKKTSYLALFVLVFAACQSDAPKYPPVAPPIELDTNNLLPNSKDIRNETLSYKNKTNTIQLQEIFIKMPAESWQLGSFKQIDKTVKQELIQKGISTPFLVETSNHCLQLKEVFQSEDDTREQRNVAEIAVFSYKTANKWLILVSEQTVRKDRPDAPKLVRQTFWDYDGKVWTVATANIPTVSEAMFFDNAPTVASNKNEVLMLIADAKKPDLLNVVVPEKFSSTNVPHAVSLLWNGEGFEVQIK